MERDVFISPPKEANTSVLWKMVKCPYGLSDSGRLWYLRLREELTKIGMIPCKFDQAIFKYFLNGNFVGLLACHVDDILFGGSVEFHDKVISKIRTIFTIGLEEDTNLKYLGLKISQDLYGINVFTDEYASSLKELPISDFECGKDFSAEQLTLLKQFCGQINWLTSQGRPDIAVDSCFLSNSLKSGDSKVFIAANKIVRKAQHQSIVLRFPRNFDPNTCYIVSFSDASFNNLPNAGSQGSYIILLVDKNGCYCPIAWQSRKVRRVIKSTIAAECLAAVEAAEMAIFIAYVIKDILQLPMITQTFLFCDNKNLVNAAHSSTNIEDKRLVIDVSILRDLLERKELTGFIWVPTDKQLANALTKRGASDKQLLNVFNKCSCFDFNSVNFK